MGEQDKPFKTIEVIDGSTGQLCKVACMSCIRGHRTTSCGIPVCRSKVFWTVKRPGRPSNSCTCRYGGSGRCKCVVAKSACPHKPKKGEKRSGECRCDEQGRYCCLIEPDHWTMLFALQKPTITFYPSREALEATHHPLAPPMTPSYSVASSHTFSSIPSTPTASSDVQSPRALLAPRLGMMGIGGPQGNHHVTPDVLSWQGQAPQAPPQPFHNIPYHSLPQPAIFEEVSPCCRAPDTTSPSLSTTGYAPMSTATSGPNLTGFAMDEQATIGSGFDIDKMNLDYFNYQFPNAICQKCGLNGCTCKNCPPVLQNFQTGSWASMCGRKHARTAEPSFSPSTLPPVASLSTSQALKDAASSAHFPAYPPEPLFESVHNYMANGTQHVDPHGTVSMSDYSDFDLQDGLGDPTEHIPLDLSDLLLSQMDDQPSSRGCCSP